MIEDYEIPSDNFSVDTKEIPRPTMTVNNEKPDANGNVDVEGGGPIDPTLSHEGEAADAKATGDAISQVNSSKADKLQDPNNANKVWTVGADGGLIFTDKGGGSSEPTDLDKYVGKKLNDVFADADALYAAYHSGNFANINVGDYWRITLNGEFWDYGNYTLIAGNKYYSDTACTDEAGTVDANTVVSSVNDANDYCEVKIGGTTRYCKIEDCLLYNVRTLNNAIMDWEVGGCNPYWGYGDSGDLANKTNHIVGFTRDGLPTTLKMRASNNRWANAEKETFEVTSATGTYTLTDTTKKIRAVRDNGRLLTYNTHYTVASGAVTLKSAAAVSVGDTLSIEYTDTDDVWAGMALNKTLNDTDHGVLRLIQQADAKLYSHIANMRLYSAAVSVANAWSGLWADRQKLFLPLETEIWGENLYGHATDATFRPQLPLFTSQKHRVKGAGNGASRTHWWCGSAYSLTSVCAVHNNGHAYSNSAYHAYAVPLGFVLS